MHKRMYLTGNEINGGLSVGSALIGTVLAQFALAINPDDRWIVQLAVTTASAFILFGIGKGIDIYFKLKEKK